MTLEAIANRLQNDGRDVLIDGSELLFGVIVSRFDRQDDHEEFAERVRLNDCPELEYAGMRYRAYDEGDYDRNDSPVYFAYTVPVTVASIAAEAASGFRCTLFEAILAAA